MEAEASGRCNREMSNLGLADTYVPDVPKDIIFPDELNAYLRDQIQYLTHENGMLKKNLAETEEKVRIDEAQLKALTKQLKQYEDVPSSDNYSSISTVASSKIVELSKRLREKSSELESMRSKYNKLEHQLVLLHQRDEEKSASGDQEDSVPNEENFAVMEDQIKQLNDKLSHTSSKLFEMKNLNLQLKNDLKLANKLLQQEIGETFENLQTMINSGNNWRGRAQIICDLQQKNNDLREKLKSYQEKKAEMRQAETVTHLKFDRRLDILSNENVVLRNDIHDLKKRLEVSRARSKALESENSVLKTRVSMLTEQQENDRDLIGTLTNQLATIKNVQNDDLKQKDQMLLKLQKECKQLSTQVTKEQCKFEHMKREFEEKLNDLSENQRCSTPHTQHSINVRDEKALSRMEAERQRLLELTEMTNKRLEDERKTIADLQLQFKAERQKNAKLESKIARIELDSSSNSGRHSTYTIMSSKPKEEDGALRDKLELAEENIKALKTRLEIERKERQLDFQEFSQIVKHFSPLSSEQNL